MKISSIRHQSYTFFAPAAVLIISFYLSDQWEKWAAHTAYQKEVNAISTLLPYFPYGLLGMGMLLGWRFQKSGMMLAAWLLGLTYWLYHVVLPPTILKNPTVFGFHELMVMLLLVQLMLLSRWRWRRITATWKITWLSLILIQTALWVQLEQSKIVSWLSNLANRLPASIPLTVKQWAETLHDLCAIRFDIFMLKAVPLVTLFFMLGGILLVIRTLTQRDVLLGGFLGCLCAVWLGFMGIPNTLNLNTAFSAAGFILIISLIEASFTLAYHDDLTGLPGRRSLNEALSSLGKRYTIAMIDVDHFKKFNDRYGHKTGDEVLKMIAVHLRQMPGGAKVFRYGGEEFTAIFSGKKATDSLSHLEAYRKKLSTTPFVVRQKTRKKSSARQRNNSAEKKAGRRVTVTVSIGTAEPGKQFKTPQQVIKAADAALYRAKRSGRNCIKT